MQQNSKKTIDNNHRKLMTVVIALSLLVFILFGLAPII